MGKGSTEGSFMNESFMKEKPVLPLLASMAFPMVLSMLVNSLYNIVDSFFVAQISEDAMTALSLVFPIQNLINAVSIGFGIGINAVVAFQLGAENRQAADQAATQGVLLSLIHGIIMTVGLYCRDACIPADVHLIGRDHSSGNAVFCDCVFIFYYYFSGNYV